MSQGDTPITLVGNLVADVELRYTQSGTPVGNARIATNPRRYDSQSNQWVDDEPLFMAVTMWRGMAESAAHGLSKGDRVIVTGTLKQRSYETREGEKRTVYDVDVDEIGPSLKFATVQVARQARDGSSNPRQRGGNPGGQQGGQQGGWSAPAQQVGGDDPWGSEQEPPF